MIHCLSLSFSEMTGMCHRYFKRRCRAGFSISCCEWTRLYLCRCRPEKLEGDREQTNCWTGAQTHMGTLSEAQGSSLHFLSFALGCLFSYCSFSVLFFSLMLSFSFPIVLLLFLPGCFPFTYSLMVPFYFFPDFFLHLSFSFSYFSLILFILNTKISL